jgi:mono/diheme cytochrome c family protein
VLRFNGNVQALVHVADTRRLAERATEHVNLNAQIATEPFPDPADPSTSLRHLFGNDIVALAADRRARKVLVLSRGGNYALLATRDAATGQLTIGAPDNVVRFQTGNLPSGVVMTTNGKRAYVNNEANCSVTAINLETNTVIERDIESCEPPAPGTRAHRVVMGKIAFFTALGIPDNDFFATPLRDIIPLDFRGKASDNAWSGCASCHPDGLTDNVTWSFETGPRQTIPLDGFFSKSHPADQRISNWSAVRSSNTDFNQNSRGVQGGCGFASAEIAGEDPPDPCTPDNALTPANPDIYNHGINTGGSDALDVQTLWIEEAVRTLLQSPATDTEAAGRGRSVFAANCASCHGGQKWTKSQVIYLDNPAFDANPAAGGLARDPNLTVGAGAQIDLYTDQNATTPDPADTITIDFADDVGTFDAADPIEIRGNNGNVPLGAIGFNSPSLLGVGSTAPYLHHGRAADLPQLFVQHNLGVGQSIADVLDDQAEQDLIVFLNTIDNRTETFRSETDDFLTAVGR